MLVSECFQGSPERMTMIVVEASHFHEIRPPRIETERAHIHVGNSQGIQLFFILFYFILLSLSLCFHQFSQSRMWGLSGNGSLRFKSD
jgi:hypothetical protein